MYHGDGNNGTLMTYYFMLGYQTKLNLKITDGKEFDFKYLDGAGFDRKNAGHIRGMKICLNKNFLVLNKAKLNT